MFVSEVLKLVIQTFNFFHNFCSLHILTPNDLWHHSNDNFYSTLNLLVFFFLGSYKFVRCCPMFGLFPTLAKILSFFSLVVLGMFLSIAFYPGNIKWKQNIFLDKHMSHSF